MDSAGPDPRRAASVYTRFEALPFPCGGPYGDVIYAAIKATDPSPTLSLGHRAEPNETRGLSTNSLCDQDSARTRSASQSTDWRRVGAFSARIR
jgi:hypothetical protein